MHLPRLPIVPCVIGVFAEQLNYKQKTVRLYAPIVNRDMTKEFVNKKKLLKTMGNEFQSCHK